MIKLWKKTYQIIYQNWITILLFELFYKIFLILIAFPIFKELLYYSLKEANIQYLNTQNLFSLFQHPTTILTLLLLIILFAFYIFIEVTGVILLCKKSIQKEKITIFTLTKETFQTAFMIMNPKNITMLLFLLIMLPIAGFFLKPTLLTSIHIPEYIMTFLFEHPFLYILYFIIVIFMIWIILKRIFSFPIAIIEKENFNIACQKSKKMIKGNLLHTFFSLLLWVIVFIGIYFLFYALLIGSIHLILYLCGKTPLQYLSELNIIIEIGKFIYSTFIFVGAFSFLTILYYHLTEQKIEIQKSKKGKRMINLWSVLYSLLLLLCILFYINYKSSPSIYNSTYHHKIQIIAHRATNHTAPENTISALKKAIKSKVEYAEIDVQETKDGELIIVHDSNLKRTTGVNEEVSSLVYQEIEKLDAGSWFSSKYKGEKIPTLEQFLIQAKGKINLIIELKNTKKKMHQKVIQFVKKYNMEQQVIIASGNYKDLIAIKKIDPSLTTNYIVAFGFGDYHSLKYADTFSIESTFITSSLVKTIHNDGKLIFAWTINKEKNVRKMVELKVDGIITDYPERTKKIINQKWILS